jgi:hypothetical protein
MDGLGLADLPITITVTDKLLTSFDEYEHILATLQLDTVTHYKIASRGFTAFLGCSRFALFVLPSLKHKDFCSVRRNRLTDLFSDLGCYSALSTAPPTPP